MMHSLRTAVVLGLALAAPLGAQASTIVIDNFRSTDSGGILSLAANPTTTTATSTQNNGGSGLSGVLGGQRTIELNYTGSFDLGTQVEARVVPSLTNPRFDYSATADATGNVRLVYDGGVLESGFDLTALGANNVIRLGFQFLDNIPLPVTLKVTDINGATGTVLASVAASAPPTQFLDFLFSDSGFSTVDFRQVTKLDFFFDPLAATDFELQFNEITITNNGVPEPSTLAGAFLGILAVGGVAYRRRKAATV
jgi:hypothetical protein